MSARTVFNRLGWVVVTLVLVSAFWVFYYNIRLGASGDEIMVAGEKEVVDPEGAPPVVVAEAVVVGPAGLAIPVAGVKPGQLVDTYTQARAGGARSHDAIDIMAPTGTPVVAAAPGKVEKLFFSDGGGGITAYVRSDDGRWSYYYAHLNAYAPGLTEGQRIERGAPIGTVGATGNANPAGPHLHFAINRMNPGEKWWQGTAINPYPLLAGKPVNG
jgi:murein DD-endopeptidase MepM/ murein hydrolase activator NlpD